MRLADTYEKVKPAVVAFSLLYRRGDKVSFRIFGSGFCVDPKGTVVTARHVVTDYFEKILKAPLPAIKPEDQTVPISGWEYRVVFFRKTSDGIEYCVSRATRFVFPAPNVETAYDLAVLQITACPVEWGGEYPYLVLGDTSTVREGDEVAISGYPLKYDLSDSRLPNLSKGIVSHKDESLSQPNKRNMAGLVLDINANPGNSGGPVFDPDSGRVLGVVVSQRLADPPGLPDELKGTFQIPAGIVYCIPSELVSTAVEAFKHGENMLPQPRQQTKNSTGMQE